MIATDFRIITEEKQVLMLAEGTTGDGAACIWFERVEDGHSIKLTLEEARELSECLLALIDR